MVSGVWNERSEAAIDELLAPHARGHGLGPEPIGREGFKEFWRFLHDTFGKVHVTVEDVLPSGPETAIRLTVTGTHQGPGLGVAATGKTVTFPAQVICVWSNGQIVEGWNVVDMDSVYKQIGAKIS